MCSKYSHKFCNCAHFMKIKCARTNQIGNISTQFFLLSNSSLRSLYFCCFLLHFRNFAWHNPLAFSPTIFPLSPFKRLLFLLWLLFFSCPQRFLLSLHRNLFHLLSIHLLSCHFLCLHLLPSFTVHSSFISANSICYLKPQSKFLLCFRLNFNSQLRA